MSDTGKLSIYDAMERLGISRSTLYSRMNEQGVETSYFNGKSFIHTADLSRLAEKPNPIQQLEEKVQLLQLEVKQLTSSLEQEKGRSAAYKEQLDQLLSAQQSEPQKISLPFFKRSPKG